MAVERVELWNDDARVHRSRLAQATNDLIEITDEAPPGQGLVVSGSVTLTPNQTTTVVTDARIQAGMNAWIFPASASASDEQMYIAPADIIDGQITINHASTGEVDKLVYWFAV